jgi:hypothetical protein
VRPPALQTHQSSHIEAIPSSAHTRRLGRFKDEPVLDMTPTINPDLVRLMQGDPNASLRSNQ